VSTLDECLRSLHHGRELLEAVAAEARFPAELRSLAFGAMQNYPCAEDIDGLLESDDFQMSDAWRDALASTRRVLLELLLLPEGDGLAAYARWIERHFPEANHLRREGGTGAQWRALFLNPMGRLEAGDERSCPQMEIFELAFWPTR
jgi:hypothetical protein